MPTEQLILASTSAYKNEQLQRLRLRFQSVNPEVDEDHTASENPKQLAELLAKQKAQAVAKLYPNSICIGSDQTAQTERGLLLTKPMTPLNAERQLMACSGQSAIFYSAVSMIGAQCSVTWSVETQVTFRELSLEECQRYVEKDNPLDCAGSFKVESLGISLFDSIQSTDPSALIGLPLITLCQRLRSLGIAIP